MNQIDYRNVCSQEKARYSIGCTMLYKLHIPDHQVIKYLGHTRLILMVFRIFFN